MVDRHTRALAATLLAMAAWAPGCGQERVPAGGPGVSAVGAGSGGSSSAASGGGGGTGVVGGGGAGGAGPPPVVADCACLAGSREDDCHLCLDEAAAQDGACGAQARACDAIELGYCTLVVDCAALCPIADAFCVDVCLGAQDEAREAAEELVSCVCGACAPLCGTGDCR